MKSQDLNMNIEIIKSINNLLNSNITNKEIMENCGLSNRTVSELRNKKKSLYTTSFSTVSDLYWFSKQKNLDTVSVELAKRKGNYKNLPFEVDIKKIFVSFEKEDMFLNGVFLNQPMLFLNNSTNSTELNNDSLISLNQPQAVLMLSSGELIDAKKSGYNFLSRYGGTAPTHFLNTLNEYSAIPREDLQEIIFGGSSIVYDALTDTIKGIPSIAGYRKFDLYAYKGRLVIQLDYLDNSPLIKTLSEARGTKREPKDITLDFLSKEVNFFRQIMTEKYSSKSSVQKVKYINDFRTPKTMIYKYNEGLNTSNDYRLIIEFKDYELWIPYNVEMPKRFKGNVFDKEEIVEFLNSINVKYEKQNVLEKIKPVEDISEIINSDPSKSGKD